MSIALESEFAPLFRIVIERFYSNWGVRSGVDSVGFCDSMFGSGCCRSHAAVICTDSLADEFGSAEMPFVSEAVEGSEFLISQSNGHDLRRIHSAAGSSAIKLFQHLGVVTSFRFGNPRADLV